MQGRRAIRLAGAAFLLTLAVACQGGGWSGPSLTDENPNPSMAGIPEVSPARHALIGSMFLCLTGPGRAVITEVRPLHPIGNIEVAGFAVRPNPFLRGADMLGTERGTLRTYGFTGNRTVDTACASPNSGQGYELGLELAVPPGTNAGTIGWQIDYSVAGHLASLTFPLGAVLCSTPNIDDEPCKRVWQHYGVHW